MLLPKYLRHISNAGLCNRMYFVQLTICLRNIYNCLLLQELETASIFGFAVLLIRFLMSFFIHELPCRYRYFGPIPDPSSGQQLVLDFIFSVDGIIINFEDFPPLTKTMIFEILPKFYSKFWLDSRLQDSSRPQDLVEDAPSKIFKTSSIRSCGLGVVWNIYKCLFKVQI